MTEHNVKSNPKRASDPGVIKAGEGERVLKLLSPQVSISFLEANSTIRGPAIRWIHAVHLAGNYLVRM